MKIVELLSGLTLNEAVRDDRGQPISGGMMAALRAHEMSGGKSHPRVWGPEADNEIGNWRNNITKGALPVSQWPKNEFVGIPPIPSYDGPEAVGKFNQQMATNTLPPSATAGGLLKAPGIPVTGPTGAAISQTPRNDPATEQQPEQSYSGRVIQPPEVDSGMARPTPQISSNMPVIQPGRQSSGSDQPKIIET